ncbi:MAG TPA: hypothetical protein VN369_04705, partial [Terriglobales bacterium]|nr:hypothetical protein [Terriglobales bacterium]
AMVYLAIELIRQFYDEARTFRITGESSRPLPVTDEGRRASGRNLGILEGAPPTAQNPLVATGQMPFPAGSTLRAIAAGMGTGASFIEFSNAGLQGDGRRPVFDVKVRAEKRNPFSQLSMNETAKELYRLGAFNPEKARESLLMLEMMEFEGIEAVKRKVAQNLALASAPPMPAMPPAPAGALPAAGAAMLPYAEQLARRAGPDMSALQKELG